MEILSPLLWGVNGGIAYDEKSGWVSGKNTSYKKDCEEKISVEALGGFSTKRK